MPACEADSWREVFHDALQVAHASACVNAWPTFQMPEGKVCSDLFVHVECGSTSKGFVDVPLCGLFVFVVVFLSSGSGVLLVMVFLKLCSVSPSVPMVFLWLWSVVQKWDLCH